MKIPKKCHNCNSTKIEINKDLLKDGWLKIKCKNCGYNNIRDFRKLIKKDEPREIK